MATKKQIIYKKIDKFKTQRQLKNTTTLQTNKDKSKFHKFTYHPFFMHKFQKIFKKFKINLALEKLINYKSNDKEVNSNKSGIYKIKCKDCEEYYIGQTSCNLETRYKEHMRHVRNKELNKSAVTAYLWSQKHKF